MTWIDVKENPPPQDRCFIGFGDDEKHIVYYNKDNEGWCTGSGCMCYNCGGRPSCAMYIKERRNDDLWVFTHWMECPEDPK